MLSKVLPGHSFYHACRYVVNKPGAAHVGLGELENNFDVTIITHNIDDLQERGGSTKVLHLHGEIFKMRSTKDETRTFDCRDEIQVGDIAKDGGQLRPHIVWFEEQVPMMEEAVKVMRTAEIFAVIGTSLLVHPG